MNYTQEQLIDLIECKGDLSFFTKRFFDFELTLSEEKRLQLTESETLKYIAWNAMFKHNRMNVLVYKNATRAIHAFKSFKQTLESLPDYLIPETRAIYRDQINFDNGSRILFKGCNPYALRGISLDNIGISTALSEKDQQEMFITAAPCVVNKPDRKIIYFS